MLQRQTRVHLAAILLALLAPLPVLAAVRLPSMFADNMVLQRGRPVPVWGWADPGEKVTVAFAGQKKTARADSNGRWRIDLNPLEASSDPRSMTVSSPTTHDSPLTIHSILVGDVWLCSGQSNMAMSVGRVANAKQEIASADYPRIRHFTVTRAHNMDPQAECAGSWAVCSTQTVAGFTATGYFFGRELHTALDVPIGLLHSSWGGTPIQAWTARAHLDAIPAARAAREALDKAADAYDEAKERAKLEAALAQWAPKAKEARAAGKRPPRKPRLRPNPRTSPKYPSVLYNAMIHPLKPYALKGAIWYQGEANAKSSNAAELYRELLTTLIRNWREDWGQGDASSGAGFPFYFVQLPNFRSAQVKPMEDGGWPRIRESFLRISREVPNTGMAITIDVGEAGNIHPRNKQAVGKRLGLAALRNTYGAKDTVGSGPVYRAMDLDGRKIVLHFDYVGAGLVAQGGGPLKGFAIAGPDQQFVRADAAIEGDTVVVQAATVAQPAAVRYAWADNPAGCNLFNTEGLPASPFRTDDWPAAAAP